MNWEFVLSLNIFKDAQVIWRKINVLNAQNFIISMKVTVIIEEEELDSIFLDVLLLIASENVRIAQMVLN